MACYFCFRLKYVIASCFSVVCFSCSANVPAVHKVQILPGSGVGASWNSGYTDALFLLLWYGLQFKVPNQQIVSCLDMCFLFLLVCSMCGVVSLFRPPYLHGGAISCRCRLPWWLGMRADSKVRIRVGRRRDLFLSRVL